MKGPFGARRRKFPRICALVALSAASAVLLVPCASSVGRATRLEPVAVSLAVSRSAPPLVTFTPKSTTEMAHIMDSAWAMAASGQKVPNLAPARVPEETNPRSLVQKKRAFLQGLLPYILRENVNIREDRQRVMGIQRALQTGDLKFSHLRDMERLAERYRVDSAQRTHTDSEPSALVEVLLRRVDEIPPSLALAQGAIESAWGTSRFAKLGNNLFGQWVFSSKGIIPLGRPEGENYSLARFEDLGEAVEAYIRNLNTLWAYGEFRRTRLEMRVRGEPLDPIRLASGLKPYSARGDEYVRDVRRIIRSNRLTRYDGKSLAGIGDAVWDAMFRRLGVSSARTAARTDSPDA